MDDDKLIMSGGGGRALWGGLPEKLYVVAEAEASDPEEVCTLSPSPSEAGWNTDLGFSGYGLPFDVAREIARRYNEARWIPVEERLPEVGTVVLCVDRGDVYFAAREYLVLRDSGPLRWVNLVRAEAEIEFSIDATLCNVTHWCPLPAPPEPAR